MPIKLPEGRNSEAERRKQMSSDIFSAAYAIFTASMSVSLLRTFMQDDTWRGDVSGLLLATLLLFMGYRLKLFPSKS